MAFTSLNMDRQVKVTTSSKVGRNSPQAATIIRVSTLQQEMRNIDRHTFC